MKIAELLQSLSGEFVQYVLVGGLAVQLHGFMRSTFDIDLVLAMNDGNLTRFIAVAKRYGLVPSIPVPIDTLRDANQIEQWHREKGMLAFALREPQIGGSVVDILVRPNVPFEQLMANAVAGELFAQKIWIASIDDLITMKRIANRANGHSKGAALENGTYCARSLSPTLSRKRARGQTNRCASFALTTNSISRRWRRSSVEKTRMFETEARARTMIPEKIMLGRLAQSEQMRDFFIQMWIQNPALAKQGGATVQNLLSQLAVADLEKNESDTF
jgi:hypothetical protein